MHSSKTIIGKGKYVLQKVIASGSFGKVYNCYPFAIKQIKFPAGKEAHINVRKHIMDTLQNEINILHQSNHQNIVKLFQVIYEKDYVYLVMEYCQSDLRVLYMNKAQGEKKALQIMLQIIQGCKEMVRLNIVHRDIKPANILVNKGLYKLADFGMAKFLQTYGDNMLKSHVGTPYYMAPQILQRKQYTKKCDIWSLGIIFYELIFGQLPWQGKDEKALLTNILGKKIRFGPSTSTDIKDVISRMLCITQQKRLGWQELFSAFEILRKNILQQNESTQRVTIHRTVLQEMITIQKQHISSHEFKKKFEQLDEDQVTYVRKMLETFIGEQYYSLIRGFIGEPKKVHESKR